MDNDQEVVREPFEDNHHTPSGYSSREQSDIGADANNACHSRQHSTIHDHDDNDHTDQLYRDTGGSSGDSCPPSPKSLMEEVEFAKSFGIDLANNSSNISNNNNKNKCNPIYENLLKSDHFVSSEQRKKNGDTGSDKASMIKTSVTSDCIYHKGTFYQKGDIVALCDQEDGQLYFAQLTGFLQDQYCEKSASVNWLVPHKPTSREFFDPSAYKIGLEDVTLRKLDCMTFIRHCPHDYYLRKFFQSGDEEAKQQSRGQVDLREKTKDRSYIWTTMKPCRVPQIEACPQSDAPQLAAVAAAAASASASHQQHHHQHNRTTLFVQAEMSP